MGIAILFAIGGILGWLASIVLAVDERRAILLYVGASILGAVLVGVLVASRSLIESISPHTVLLGSLGAIGSFVIAHAVREVLPDSF